MLKIENLTKRYKGEEIALKGVSLEIKKGQVVGLIGPSGAGKSTLIRCINRLIEPSSGEVWLEGVNLPSLSRTKLKEARREMGMIFQEYALIERLSVMENVLSGRLGYHSFWRTFWRRFPEAEVERAFYYLERVGLIEHYNKRADQLSGGQRQRVGIARALAQEPKVLLVDEPTASLDPKTSRQVMRLLLELCREKELLAIVNIHDVPLAQAFMERIVGLRAGEVVFDGAPSELDERALTEIYGEEEWKTLQKTHQEEFPLGEDSSLLYAKAEITG